MRAGNLNELLNKSVQIRFDFNYEIEAKLISIDSQKITVQIFTGELYDYNWTNVKRVQWEFIPLGLKNPCYQKRKV